jgi:hypothetical protein
MKPNELLYTDRMELRFHPEPSAANIASWLSERRSRLWQFALFGLTGAWDLGFLTIIDRLPYGWCGEQGAYPCIVPGIQPT